MLRSMHSLTGLLDRQGKYEEAEDMNQRTLELREKTLGKDHPNTLDSMDRLAYVLTKQDKH
jgi:hypothetical protein